MEKRKLPLAILALVIVSLACGLLGGNNTSSPTGNNIVTEENLPTPTATLALQTNTPLPDDEQSYALPPLSYVEILENGVENNLWTEGEGLLNMMQYIIGETGPDNLPGVTQVTNLEATGIVEITNEYLDQPDHDPEIGDQLERLLRILFPPLEVLEQISRPQSAISHNKLASAELMVPEQDQDACADLAGAGYDAEETDYDGDDNPYAEFFSDCYVYAERTLDGRTFRVYYPTEWEGNEERQARVFVSLDALAESAVGYADMPGLRVGDLHLAFGLIPYDIAKGFASSFDPETEACPITILPLADEFPDDKYKQIIAHEVFHCVQEWTFRVEGDYDINQWWVEGSAEYFSNLIYPYTNLEFRNLDHLNTYSAYTSIFDMSYENFAFFQFMGNKYGTDTLFEILRSLSNGGSIDEQQSVMAAVSQMDENFNLYTVELLSSGVLDSGGTRIKFEDPKPTGTKTISDKGDVEFTIQPFVAMRYTANYKQEKRFLQNPPNPGENQFSGVEYSIRQNIDAWSDLPPEIRSECKKDVRYLYAITTTQDFYTTHTIDVTLAEKAECDPCLLGTWDVDPVSYANAMKKIMAQGGADVGLIVEGHMYLQFVTDGKAITQRENFAITGNGIVTATLNGLGGGNYTANGEEITVTNFVDTTDSVGIGFFGAPDPNPYTGPMLNKDNAPQNETAPYVCKQDELTITMPEMGDVLWHRVNKILPTPVPTAVPPDQPQP